MKLDLFCFKLLPNSDTTDIVLVTALAQQLKQQLRITLVAAQWRGDTAIKLPLFWRRSTASSVFRVGARGRAFTLSFPSLMSILASVDVKQNVYFQAVDCPSVPLQDYSS